MNWKWGVFILFLSCQWVKPADPEFRQKPLMNEQFSGFISKDFFQVVVKVDANADSIPIRDKRNDCKRRSVPLRNRMTIPLLVNEVIDSENDRIRGINRIRFSYPTPGSASDTAASGGFDFDGSSLPIATPLSPAIRSSNSDSPNPSPTNPTGSTAGTRSTAQGNPNQNSNSTNPNGPNQNDPRLTQDLLAKRKTYGELLMDKELKVLQGEFTWFLDSMKLYKEDYSNPNECVFIYRVAKKGLYDKIEETGLSIRWEDYE